MCKVCEVSKEDDNKFRGNLIIVCRDFFIQVVMLIMLVKYFNRNKLEYITYLNKRLRYSKDDSNVPTE